MDEGMRKAVLSRATLLLGEKAIDDLSKARVIIFGVGGVGSWCAESLVRSGVSHLTIVDSDNVCISNINRQRMATFQTIGKRKVDALKDMLLTISPDADITAICETFSEDTCGDFLLDEYDYVIDAIDSIKDKMLLINMATRSKATLYSSMGAALKLDPARIRTAEFWKVTGCPLARSLRERFKKSEMKPARKFRCVYSDELLKNKGSQPIPEIAILDSGTDEHKLNVNGSYDQKKSKINGSIMHITAIFGLTLASMVIEDIVSRQGR